MKIYNLGDVTQMKLQVLEQNEDTSHAKYSPSKLKSIILCPGSKKYIDRPSQSNSYASAGTWLHHLVSFLANTAPGVDWSKIDRIECIPPLEEDESDAVLAALLEIQKQRIEHGTFDMKFEHPVCTTDPNVFGTADFIIHNKTHCTLIDWKFGKGVKVDDFTQLRAYAKGVENTIKKFQSYTLIVFQPIYHDGFHYASEVITREELDNWWNTEVQPALYEHHNYNASTEACRWCLGKSECRVRYNQVLDAATKMFADEPVPVLVEEKLGLWNQRAQITAYLKEIEEELRALAATGNLPGYKVVPGRSNSAWINQTQAEALLKVVLKDEAYTRKLVSPTQARKKFKGRSKEDLEALEALIHKPIGKPNLAPESDARPAMDSAVFAAFVEDSDD